MKRILIVLLAGVFLVGCDRAGILNGYTDCEEYFDEEGFADYTDYCKYYYEEGSESRFAENGLYERVGTSIKVVKEYFENCQSMMELGDRGDDYDFDDSCISEDDYVYMDVKNEGSDLRKFDDYDVFLYDVEGHTLYFIHNNN